MTAPATVTAPPRPPLTHIAARTGAALAGLLFLAGAASLTGHPLFALPFAATVGIIAVAPTAPFAQPRSILLGHLGGAATGLAATALLGRSAWTAAIAAALSTVPMLLMRAPHPPAGATAALVGLTAPGWLFLLDPVVPASLVAIAGGVIVGKVLRGHRYPAYWW
ncbi:MAG TPA: HPP family protein [Phytomonospora sp.]